jgi:hypothetical protein
MVTVMRRSLPGGEWIILMEVGTTTNTDFSSGEGEDEDCARAGVEKL